MTITQRGNITMKKQDWIMVMGRIQNSGNDWGNYYNFSVDCHGEEKALELAREYIRRQMNEWPKVECKINRRHW